MQIVCRLTNQVSPARRPFGANWNVHLQEVQELYSLQRDLQKVLNAPADQRSLEVLTSHEHMGFDTSFSSALPTLPRHRLECLSPACSSEVVGTWVKPVPWSPAGGGRGLEREARKEQGGGMAGNNGRPPTSPTPRVLHAVPTSARFSHLLFCGLCARLLLLSDVLVCSLLVRQAARGGA